MREVEIRHLAYILKRAKEDNKPKPIFFLGAGASKTGNMPSTPKIVEDIKESYKDNPYIDDLNDEDKNDYYKLMECLDPQDRNALLKKYVDKAKINVTHIYLAHLMKEGYVDYVLTVNFDNLMLRALALFNIFPPAYDLAILKDLTTSKPHEKSVIYLHGQHHGLWLLNTDAEMGKVTKTATTIFDSIKDKRPWIFIGYSGRDKIFQCIKERGRFDNRLYWIAYKDEEPIPEVKDFIEKPNTEASIITGYDSDSFMLKLNNELGLDQPAVFEKPFTSMRNMLDNIEDINDNEEFARVKERLIIAKRQVSEAIKLFETVPKDESALIKKISKERKSKFLEKRIINLIAKGEYDLHIINKIENDIENSSLNLREKKRMDSYLSVLFCNWGIYLGKLAETKKGIEAEELYKQAFEKFQKATELEPGYYHADYNWGTSLVKLAEAKKGIEAEELYKQAFEKFQKAIEIKSDKPEAFYNFGNALIRLAEAKKGIEAEELYKQAFEKFQKAIEIKSDKPEAFNTWGGSLGKLARLKGGVEAEGLYKQAFEKCERAKELSGRCYNLACLYALTEQKQKALYYLDESLKNDEIATEFVKRDSDWKSFLQDNDFKKVLDKYEKR